jgi:hypothetical protein
VGQAAPVDRRAEPGHQVRQGHQVHQVRPAHREPTLPGVAEPGPLERPLLQALRQARIPSEAERRVVEGQACSARPRVR